MARYPRVFGSPAARAQSRAAFAASGAIVTPLSITGTPAAATQGTPYSFTPAVSGGSGTRTFALSFTPATGTLPAGLSFSTTTGAITGTPTASGTASGLAITVTDASGSATLSGLSIVVGAAVAGLIVYAGTLSGVDIGAFTGAVGSPRYGDRPPSGDGYTSQFFTVSGGRLLVGSDF